MDDVIKKLILVNVPVSTCNLQCHYCYISQTGAWRCKNNAVFNPELVEKALSKERLGGICIVNLTGVGETLIPKEMPEIIRRLLSQGHYLEVVTNGTLSKRFEEIAKLPADLLSRLEFKFSFHYLQLKEKNMMDIFFRNVHLMRNAGCSFTIEIMPNDEMIPYIDEIKKICIDNVGALCHATVGRNEKDNKNILTKLNPKEYQETWGSFHSTMFDFKYRVFGVKRKEFCYAGTWSLFINLLTGEARQCYHTKVVQNIYDLAKPLYFRPVGHKCPEPFCFNAHAHMALGLLPGVEAPTYADIRDRIDVNGDHWLKDNVRKAFSTKLYNNNKPFTGIDLISFYLQYPAYWVKILRVNKDKIRDLLKKKMHNF